MCLASIISTKLPATTGNVNTNLTDKWCMLT